MEGDLVIVQSDSTAKEEVDAGGEVIIKPEGEGRATTSKDYEKARPLTKDEVESGNFTIFDIVLPLPGFDIVYPPNELGEFYKEFMGNERCNGLDPLNMRR